MSVTVAETLPAANPDDARVEEYCSTLDEMKESMAAVREVVKSLHKKCVAVLCRKRSTTYHAF